MYRSGKGKIANRSGLLGKQRDAVSNIPEHVAVCCFHGGDKLWKQQEKHNMRQLSTSKRSTICLRRLSASAGLWTARYTLSAVILQAERILEKQWNGLQRSKLIKEKRGKTV